jgi:hydroxymethylpyrimidine pyrophosphatase-like HAD family hydrolase
VERYAFTHRGYVTDTPCPETLPYSQGLGIPIDEVPDLVEATCEGVISLVFRSSHSDPDHERLADRLKAEIETLSEGEFRVEKSLPHLLEVLHCGASKGEALRALCSLLEVPLESSMAIGDGFGDIAMIDAAGTGVLVANAHPSLSGGLRKRTRAPYAEGVLEAVKTFVLGEG